MTRELHPDSLQAWINKTYLDEKGEEKQNDLIYFKGALDQAIYVRDVLGANVCRGVEYEHRKDGSHVKVVSEHMSKSCPLAVYSLEPPGKGIRFVLRGNFYNWKVSVISDKPIDIDPIGLFRGDPPTAPRYAGDHLVSCYFEGFPGDLVFGYYSESDKMRFSVELGDREEVWAFIFLCLRSYEGDAWRVSKQKNDEEMRLKEAEHIKERARQDVERLEAQLKQKRQEAGL